MAVNYLTTCHYTSEHGILLHHLVLFSFKIGERRMDLQNVLGSEMLNLVSFKICIYVS